MDAGTDNGFTFTAPNWATTPPATIFRITNVYPTHPASSFHYPDLDSLPSIATFSFIKVNHHSKEMTGRGRNWDTVTGLFKVTAIFRNCIVTVLHFQNKECIRTWGYLRAGKVSLLMSSD